MRRTVAATLTLGALLAIGSVPAGAQEAQVDDVTGGEARVIQIEAKALEFVQDGEPVTDIPVTPGETVIIEVNNTSGIKHDFYIGTDEELKVPEGTTDTGLTAWIRNGDTRIKQLEWTVPDDISGLKFGCTILGHYDAMQGTFSLVGDGREAEAGQPSASLLELAARIPACDPAATDVAACRSKALAATRELFDAELKELTQDQNDAWRAGDDPVPSNLAVAQWADDFVVAVERIGLADRLPAEMVEFAAAYAAYAQYTRDNADVVLSERPEEDVLHHLQARGKTLIALTQALAAAE